MVTVEQSSSKLSDYIYIYICVCVCMCGCVRVRACVCLCIPTPPREQDTTQSQFLSRIWQAWISIFFSKIGCHTKAKNSCLPYYFINSWRENSWIHTFSKCISAIWNANSLNQELNTGRCVYFTYGDNRYTTTAYIFDVDCWGFRDDYAWKCFVTLYW